MKNLFISPFIFFLLITSTGFAQSVPSSETGTVVGRVRTAEDEPAIGLPATIVGTRLGAVTNASGEFTIFQVPAGEQTVVFSGLGYKKLSRKITVVAGESVRMDAILEIESVRAQDVIVYGAARRQQRITEAPASVAVISQQELLRAAPHGQLTKMLEHQTGIDVAQSGSNDFNVNTRGFNSSINRRVLVLIDGRDPSTPLLNLQEWNSLAASLSDVQQIEVVRGPGSALFGTNAYNGVINITTNSPKQALGTRLSFTGGDFETRKGDARIAVANGKLSAKLNFGYASQFNYFLVSRQTTLEYDGLARDVRPLTEDQRRPFSYLANARIDYDFTDNDRVVFETGMSYSGNEFYVNAIGRLLVVSAEKPFVRAAYNSPNFNAQLTWNRRSTPEPQLVFNAPATSAERSDDYLGEVQWNSAFLERKLRTVAGASYQFQNVNTSVVGAVPLLAPDNLRNSFAGIYGQLEYILTPELQVVGAVRADFSTLIETKLSPKVGVVWTPLENQTLRFTVNQSFLRPSYPDFYRRSPAQLDASIVSAGKFIDSTLTAQSGSTVVTGIASAASFSIGNPNIKPEESTSFELGYKGIINKSIFVTTDLYFNRRSNFISSPLGGLAPDVYPAYRSNLTGGLEQYNGFVDSTLQARLAPAVQARLAQFEGKAASLIVPANIGLINELGAELAVNYYLGESLLLTANYAYIDVKVIENTVTSQKIFPNTSRHRMNFGATYTHRTLFDAAANLKYVEGFEWLAGLIEGRVPSYAVLNLNANVNLTRNLRAGVNVFNALDRKHYEIFGGTVLGRYTTANVVLTF